MKTIKVDIIVVEDGRIEGQAPPDLAPGRYKVAVPVTGVANGDQQDEVNLPLHDVGAWPENLSLRREDLYDEWGR